MAVKVTKKVKHAMFSQNKCLDYILHGKFCSSKSATLLHYATLLNSIYTVIVNKGYKTNVSSCINVQTYRCTVVPLVTSGRDDAYKPRNTLIVQFVNLFNKKYSWLSNHSLNIFMN